MTSGNPNFPPPPGSVHLVGIGGIGMSGLAQLLRTLGYEVSGSDRDLTGPGRTDLYRRLDSQGITVTAQDGSGIARFRPCAIICSAAIESDNPDLGAATGIPVFGRAATLARLFDSLPGRQIAIAGSAGKTSVTAWTAAALRALGHRVMMVAGGDVIDFETDRAPGNFFADPAPEWIVYETDESDGSLIEFHPEIGTVLNIGTDHHSRDRLTEMFRRFARNCQRVVVLRAEVQGVVDAGDRKPMVVFGSAVSADDAPDPVDRVPGPVDCRTTRDGIVFSIPGVGGFTARQYGWHSAENACAVLAILRAALGPDLSSGTLRTALAAFRGVRRRFENVGCTDRGTPVFVDYAHNVEKIRCALQTAQELAPNRVLAIWQPHGYGPLGFMRRELAQMLAAVLRPRDSFVFLPVYYAGGTTSFSPTSEAVATEAGAGGVPVTAVPGREEAKKMIRAECSEHGMVLILGARDPSLPVWARSLVRGECPGDVTA